MQKKRFILAAALSLAALLMPVGLTAGPVSVDKARSVARTFFYGNGPAPASELELVWDGVTVKTKGAASPAFYIFNRGEDGFVMVSGDDALEPVLGWSDEGGFQVDGMPSHVADWFRQINDYVAAGRSANAQASARTRAAWAEMSASDPTPVVLLETPNWNQDYPYNIFCPDNCLAGCVATAMAIVLRTIKYPSHGVGTVPGYTTTEKKYVIPDNKLGHEYLWDKMPMSDFWDGGSAWTEENINQVARLMYDCGTMVQMDYTPSSSSAYSDPVPGSLARYMLTDGGAYLMLANLYKTSEWISMLEKQLDAGFPLFYDGDDPSPQGGGHAFVVDGYDTQNRLHINFGWGGIDNAFYTFPQFGTEPGYSFTDNHGAVFGIKPDEGGQQVEPVIAFFQTYDSETGQYSKGFVLDVESPVPGQKFTLLADGHIRNFGPGVFSGDLVPARVDKDGNIKETLCSYISVDNLQMNWGIPQASFEGCRFTSVSKGDVIRIAYRPKGTRSWKAGLSDHIEGFVGEYPLSKDNPEFSRDVAFKLDLKKSVLTIAFPEDAQFSITDTSGVPVTRGVTVKKGSAEISKTDLKSGIYIIKLEKDGQVKSMSITL